MGSCYFGACIYNNSYNSNSNNKLCKIVHNILLWCLFYSKWGYALLESPGALRVCMRIRVKALVHFIFLHWGSKVGGYFTFLGGLLMETNLSNVASIFKSALCLVFQDTVVKDENSHYKSFLLNYFFIYSDKGRNMV